jgi:hypothetical protein
MVRAALSCFLLSLCLGAPGLHAQSGADRPIQSTAGSSSKPSYREIWQQMHRLPPIPKMAGAAQSHGLADAAPGSTPSFAGFYAAQTIAGVAPIGGPVAGLPNTANPTRMAFLTADFNNDGHPDLATVDANGGVAVSLNDGSGHFGTPVMTAPSLASLNALGVVAADLNGDGFPDLVVLTPNSQIVVLTNQKNGAFTQTAVLTLPNASTTQNLETGVFNFAFTAGLTGNSKNADIIAEYIVAPPSGQPGVPVAPSTLYRVTFLNDGAGGFSSAAQKLVSTTMPTSSTLLPGRLILADVNHDGKPDLVTGIGSSATYMASYMVDVAMGNGDGTFAAPAANTVATVPGDKSPAEESPSLLLTSLSKNASELDLLIALDNNVYYAAANGDGTYKTPVLALQRGNFQSEDIASIQVEDFNGDGLPDLFVSGAGELTSYPGNGDGTFGKAVSSVVTNASDSSYPGLALADFDSDGKLDFVASSYQSQDVAFGKGLGDGKFIATPFLFTSTMPPDSFAGSTALDANGDGKTDLVCVNLEDGSLVTALTGAGGAFTYKVALPASTTTYTYPQYVYGDFNGDGKPDLVVSLTTVGTPGTYGAGVALSNGDGTFQTPVPIQLPVSLTDGIQYNAFAVGDVNGDGKLDLVFTYTGYFTVPQSTGPNGYFVALGNGDGTFHEATFVPFGATPYYVLLDHFHGSKAPLDLVIADVNYPQVSKQQVTLLTGTGDGTFGSPAVLASGYYFFGLLSADFNKDGNPDLVVSAPVSFTNYPSLGGFLAYTGNGDGTFSPSTVMAANGFPGTAIAADVNGDGNPDIVFSTAPLQATGLPISVSGLSVLLGNRDSSFGSMTGYPMSGTTLFAGNFLGDNGQSIVGNAAGSAFFMNQGGTMVTLASTPSTIVAQVKPTLNGRPTPTGTGTFLDGTTVLGTGALANGAASAGLSQLTVGTHVITFQYSGDANFQPNTASSTITVTTAPAPDFSISSSPPSLSVTPGQTVKAQLTITANAGLSGSVTFACSGLPAESTCSFAPASLTATPGQASTTTLSISTTAASSVLRTLARMTRERTMTALAFLLIVPFCSGRRRQWLRFSLLIGVLTLSAVSIVGCGGTGSSSMGSTETGSPAGSYTVTVTATSATGGMTITHTLPLTVVIQ